MAPQLHLSHGTVLTSSPPGAHFYAGPSLPYYEIAIVHLIIKSRGMNFWGAICQYRPARRGRRGRQWNCLKASCRMETFIYVCKQNVQAAGAGGGGGGFVDSGFGIPGFVDSGFVDSGSLKKFI